MNGILLVDKPAGWTSQDAAAKLRGLTGERRIGHSGTLDPMATGLLVMFLGRATRAVEFAEVHDKEYVAGLRLGLTTDTQDTTGTELRRAEADISREALEAVLPAFRGTIWQTPPMYSAVKVGGRRLYEIARSGGQAEVKPRQVTVTALEILSGAGADWTLRVECSKGTYIRALCSDIGAALGCGGCMSALRRTRCGMFRVESASTMDQLRSAAGTGALEELLLPAEDIFASFPEARVPAGLERKCRNGNPFPIPLPDGEYRVLSASGEFLMLGECAGGMMRTIKSFFEV